MLRSTMQFTILALLLIVFVGVAGCANPYGTYYESMLERWPNSRAMLMASPEAENPQLVTTNDRRADLQTMLQNGYLLIGKATFRSARINEAQALEQARKVGADVVLTNQEYVATVTQSVPITEWLPARQLTTTERYTTRNNPDSPPVIAERVITRTLEGEAYVRYVPQDIDYYDYSATFWKKARPYVFGVLVQALDDATKLRLQTNRAVIVTVVVNRSPAFAADVLRGDIITHFDRAPVLDPADFFEKVNTQAGRQVTVTIIRNGVARDVTLTLREIDPHAA